MTNKDPQAEPAGCHDRLPAFADYLDHHPLPVLVYRDDTLEIVEANTAAISKYGYLRTELLGMTIEQIRPPENLPALHAALKERRLTNHHESNEGQHLLADGTVIDVLVSSYPYSVNDPNLLAVVVQDVTERRQLTDELRRQTAFFRQLFENSPDGIAILDETNSVIETNAAFLKMFGYASGECTGRKLDELVAREVDRSDAEAISRQARQDRLRVDSLLRHRKDGSPIRVDALGYPITTTQGNVGIYAIYRDVSEKYEALQELNHRARHDSLTSLLNRHELETRIEHLIADSRTTSQDTRHAFIYLDLDEFKLVNDTSGHLAGDRLLVAVSNALQQNVKGSDAVARLGGDEFALLLYNCNLDDACAIAERIRNDVAQLTLDWSEGRYSVGTSIGVAMLDKSINSFEELMNNADAACYVAKNAGKDRIEVYRVDNEEIAGRREQGSWILKLRAALGEKRFKLFRQRIVPISSESNNPDHYEILLRLIEEDGTVVPPASFIPTAERFNLMADIDLHVIEMVVQRLERTQRDITCYSINISGISLGQPEFTAHVTAILAESNISMERLNFEITETAAITRMDMAKEFIAAMRELGARVSLDDFGSGMSSFSYLKTLPVDVLKIDGLFIRDMLTNSKDYAIVEAFNRIGHALGMRTVAEFVENEDILEALRCIGVDFAQGYGIHKPEPWEDD